RSEARSTTDDGSATAVLEPLWWVTKDDRGAHHEHLHRRPDRRPDGGEPDDQGARPGRREPAYGQGSPRCAPRIRALDPAPAGTAPAALVGVPLRPLSALTAPNTRPARGGSRLPARPAAPLARFPAFSYDGERGRLGPCR